MKCKCGSESFHRFFYHETFDIERFRCKECKQAYQRIGEDITEIDLKAMWDKAVSRIVGSQ